MKISANIALLSLCLFALNLFTDQATAQSIQPVEFDRSNVLAFQIESEFLEPTMLVEVALPSSYSADDSRTYPVMYFTDGALGFPLLMSNNSLLSFGHEIVSPPWIPEVISVGIEFVLPAEQIEPHRLAFFTPTETLDEDYGLIGGGADQLLDFIRHELKPFINSTFRVDTDQEVFGGHSLGGLLALYTLFTQPDLFDRFIASSPSIYWDEQIIRDFEYAYYASRPSEAETLFMSVGSKEDPWGITLGYVKQMGRQITRHRYDNLRFKMKVFRGENHQSVVANAFAKGARFVFEDSSVRDSSHLD